MIKLSWRDLIQAALLVVGLKLLAACEMTLECHLEGIDALLGCALMVREGEEVKTCNWIRELINVFGSCALKQEMNDEIKGWSAMFTPRLGRKIVPATVACG